MLYHSLMYHTFTKQINEKQVQRWTHLDEFSDVLRFDGVRISSAELGTIHGQKLLESYL